MPTRPTDPRFLRLAHETWLRNDCNAAAAARELDWPVSTTKDRVNEFQRTQEKEHEPVTPPPKINSEKPRYRVSIDKRQTHEKVRITFWTDSHDSPRLDKTRFKAIGEHVARTKPDLVIHGGDFSSFDSLCRYDGNETLKGKSKPTFDEDIESMRDAMAWYRDGLGNYECPHHCTLGNHEDRVLSFMDRNPELAGFIDNHFYTVFEQFGWTYSPFGQHHYVAGVSFTHAPLNTMGKPYGGMHAENQIARDALESTVFGHTHKRLCKTYAKSNHRSIQIVNGGCSMPDGHIEPYKGHSLSGWTWGIYDLTLQGGQITDQWIPMSDL